MDVERDDPETALGAYRLLVDGVRLYQRNGLLIGGDPSVKAARPCRTTAPLPPEQSRG